MSLKLNTASGGSITLQEADTASNLTITVPAVTATMAIDGAAFFARLSGFQTISFATATKVALDTELFDTNSNFDTTNYRFTPTVAGYYQISSAMRGAGSTSNTGISILIYKNGSAFTSTTTSATALTQFVNHSVLVYLNGSTDYIELYGTINGTGTASFNPTNANNAFQTWMSGVLVRSA
jgi:hypothetical protein